MEKKRLNKTKIDMERKKIMKSKKVKGKAIEKRRVRIRD